MGLLLQFNQEYLPAFGNNWRRFLLLGTILTILGLIAISTATFTTILSTILLGFIIFFSGAVILFDAFTFWRGKLSGFFLNLILAILYLCAGLVLITNPVEGSISLTFLLGIVYIIVGIFRIGFYSVMQTPNWGWAWFNGVITLILGVLIITNWPVSGLFIIGLFVGIDLVFCGWAYIMSALAARSIVKQ